MATVDINHHFTGRGVACLGVLCWILVAQAGCTGDSEPVVPNEGNSAASAPGSSGDDSRVTELEVVETLSEDVANRLIEFSDAIRKRDFDAARDYLSDRFQGTPVGATLPAAAPAWEARAVDVSSDSVDRATFMESVEELLRPLTRIDHVFFKTRGAEFDSSQRHGTVRLTIHVIGRLEGNQLFSYYGWAAGAVTRTGNPSDLEGTWQLSELRLGRAQVKQRPEAAFTNVAAPAGLAVTLPRLGRDGNDKFHWRGAASVDVDGDGLFDLFTSTHDRNYLYRNRGDGGFSEEAEARGLEAPVGATSPLFFDFDNDGDADLFLGSVGWLGEGAPGGNPLKLFRNDGDGRFRDVSESMGLIEVYACAFSTVAADFNGDGWLDLYVCGYERLESVYPNSWYRATNGTPNLLLLNREGRRFENVADASGVAGTAWSYAAAAADFDDDGDQDLYVANDYGDNQLFVNAGDGTFVDRASQYGVVDTGNGMGVLWGDSDSDGQLDLYVSNMSSSAGNRILKRLAKGETSDVESTLFKLAAGNSLFRRRGERFEAHASDQGGLGASWAWGAAFLDANLDGVQDLYVANGFISGDSLKDT